MKNKSKKIFSPRKFLRGFIFPAAMTGIVLLSITKQHAQNRPPQTSQNFAERIELIINQTHKIVFPETVSVATPTDESVATTEIIGNNTLLIRGVDFGETVVVVTTESGRKFFVVEVVGQPITTVAELSAKQRNTTKSSRDSGFYNANLAFSPATSGSVFQQKLNYRRRLTTNKRLRINAEWTQNFGSNDRLNIFTTPRRQIETINIGVETAAAQIDLLDSEIVVSPLSFNNFSIRGVRLAAAENSKFRGLEFFAGITHSVFRFFEPSESKVFGIIAPLLTTPKLKVKAAAYFVEPRRKSPSESSSGEVFQILAAYTPNKRLALEGEAQFAKNQLSWRGYFKNSFDKFEFSGEAEFLAADSPLVGIRAQIAGRKHADGAVNWQPTNRLGFSASFNQTKSLQLTESRRFAPNQKIIQAGANYRFGDNWQIGVRFSDQKTSLNLANTAFNFDLETRTYSFFAAGVLPKHWRQRLETSFSQSRETTSSATSEKGFSFSYEIQRSWNNSSVTAFYNRLQNQNSPAGLILRNPAVLPTPLREAFLANPTLFLTEQRDLLNRIFPNLDLSANRQTNFGGRFQANLKRLNFYAEARVLSGTSNRFSQSGMTLNGSATWRIDDANAVGLRTSNYFFKTLNAAGNFNRSTDLIFSYTHQFGVADGFQFSKLFSRKSRTLRGRIFEDRNSNGQIDANEQGIANVKIRLDDRRTVISDKNGEFAFSGLAAESHQIVLDVEGLGKIWRASSSISQTVDLNSVKSAEVNFGLNNYGFLAGRIFNDLNFGGKNEDTFPGIGFVKVKIQPLDKGNAPSVPAQTQNTDGGGQFNFRMLPPGDYRLEILPESLPENYEIPAETSWIITVSPLRGFYKDIPLAAQRAVRGIVFIDRNNNGQFDAETDSPVGNTKIVAGKQEAKSDENGMYLLRNLPSGEIDVQAFLPDGTKTTIVTLNLDSEPIFLQNINLIFTNP
jgi:hypothetical protein